jgi:curved DNA-binding protein CbpA
MKNYYAILGVRKTATDNEIKNAYRMLAKQYHPDMNPDKPGVEEKLKDINEAYATLNDSETRAHYDKKYDQFLQWQRHRANYEYALKLYESRKAYAIILDPGFLKDLFNESVKKFHALLVKDPGVIAWLHFLSHSYLIVVDKNIPSGNISNFIHQTIPGKQHLVIEVNLDNQKGILTPEARDWIRQFVKPVQVPAAV